MKKIYESPVAEKIEFCYADQVVASNSSTGCTGFGVHVSGDSYGCSGSGSSTSGKLFF